MIAPNWIGVDWGTSNLRVFAMRGRQVLAQASSGAGMARLAPGGFQDALLALIAPWLDAAGLGAEGLGADKGGAAGSPMPVICAGMVGARQGWFDAGYRPVPCAPVAPGTAVTVPGTDPRMAVQIVPGLSQAAPADVMRGEEAQIAGFLALHPGHAGTLILPGTHSKHVQVGGGRVLAFATHMTGELHEAIGTHTILRQTLAAGGGPDRPEAFAEGVRDGLGGQALARLFALRAEGMLGGMQPPEAAARLSGLLIGAELASLPPGPALAVIGSGALSDRYRRALAVAGRAAQVHDGAALVLGGLALARGPANLEGDRSCAT